MPQTFYVVPTAAGDAKQANANALGLPRRFTQMAVGDGNGALPVPDRNRTALVNERRRAPLNALTPDAANPGQYIAEQVIPENTGGWWIRELGLYDEDGTLCYYGNCPETYKPQLAEGSGRTQVVRMVIVVSGAATVEIKIDPSIVLATREYCDRAITAAMEKLDSKQSVRVATVGNLAALSGLLTVDGVVLAAGDRVLVKDQATGKDNGIYTAAAGAWARAADADAALEVTPGMLVPVEQGTVNADSLWQLATDGTITLGTTALLFEMAAGKSGVTAGTYRSVTVDSRGRVVGGTNPTTLAGFGITDASNAATVVSEPGVTLLTNANAGLVLINAADGNITLKLPDVEATSIAFHLVRIDAVPSNIVTVQSSGTDTIDGSVVTSFKLVGASDSRALKSNGLSAWYTFSSVLASYAAAYQSAAQSIAPGTFMKVALQTKTADAGGEFDIATYRFTAKQTGIYHVDAAVNFAMPGNAGYFGAIFKSGSMTLRGSSIFSSSGASQAVSTISGDVPLNAGEYLELYAYSDAAVTLAAIPSSTRFNVHRIR